MSSWSGSCQQTDIFCTELQADSIICMYLRIDPSLVTSSLTVCLSVFNHSPKYDWIFWCFYGQERFLQDPFLTVSLGMILRSQPPSSKYGGTHLPTQTTHEFSFFLLLSEKIVSFGLKKKTYLIMWIISYLSSPSVFSPCTFYQWNLMLLWAKDLILVYRGILRQHIVRLFCMSTNDRQSCMLPLPREK